MIEIIWDKPFLRILKKWKKKHPDLIADFQDILILFTEKPFHPSLKTHNLSGKLKGETVGKRRFSVIKTMQLI
ncbi:MAG: hypothetical protein NUV44_06100 [Candidatus Scalindua sp.]|nr:hypothetical protein [Candidatus Scalindua sp.]